MISRPSPSEAVCILLSTWDGQQEVARITSSEIDRRWAEHPPIVQCGCSQYGDREDGLPLRSDSRDWMGIHADACGDLLQRGFEWTYLVLDDHAPVGRCHARHLNVTLPRLAKKHRALIIGLNGWGQGRPDGKGRVLKGPYRLEQVGTSFDWKFSLHPGLWHLPSLHALLSAWCALLPLEDRNAWKFERMGQGMSVTDYLHEYRPSFRVNGRRMRHAFSMTPIQRVRLMRLHLAAAAVHRLSPETPAEKYRFLYRFYDGPYPLYWSGLLQRGRTHENCLRFLGELGETGLPDRLLELQAGSGAAADSAS